MSSAEEKDGIVQNTIDWNHPAACKPTIIDHEQPLIDWHGRTKLAIVGFASSTRDKAPFDDPSWVVWGLNQLNRHIPRADAWIDIHHDFDAAEKVIEGTDFRGFLRSAPIPIFMAKRQPDIPGSVRYPVEEIVAKFGADYFTSTISYMIAYGVYAGFRTIGIWGVDLIVGKEYFHQKACAEFWLGMANALGISIVLPEDTALLKGFYRYGYQDEPNWGIVKASEYQKRIDEIDKRKDLLIRELNTIDGARQDCVYWLELMTLRLRGGTVPSR